MIAPQSPATVEYHCIRQLRKVKTPSLAGSLCNQKCLRPHAHYPAKGCSRNLARLRNGLIDGGNHTHDFGVLHGLLLLDLLLSPEYGVDAKLELRNLGFLLGFYRRIRRSFH